MNSTVCAESRVPAEEDRCAYQRHAARARDILAASY